MEMVFFDGQQAVDVIDAAGLGRFSGRGKEQLEAQYGPLEVIDSEEAYRRIQQRATTGPKETDRESFWHALECLPPMKWVTRLGGESFRVPEPLVANIYSTYVRIGERYFQMEQPSTVTHEELLAMVAKHIAAEPVSA